MQANRAAAGGGSERPMSASRAAHIRTAAEEKGQAWIAAPLADMRHGFVVALGLLAMALLLTWATFRLSSETTVAFYFAATALATWYGGLRAGALVVVGGSLLTIHSMDKATVWDSTQVAWARLAAFAVVAAALVMLLEAVRQGGRALTSSLEQQRAILQLLPVGVAIVERADATPFEARINPALAAMLGTHDERLDLNGAAAHGVTFEKDNDFDKDNDVEARPSDLPLHRAIATGSLTAEERLQVARSDRPTMHIRAQAAPLLEDGKPRGAVGVYVDETESHDREARLREANELKDRFLGMISHELKTPLTIISGNAEILERTLPTPDEALRYALEDMRSASGRLLANVENLLTLARVGDRTLELEPFPLCRTIHDVVSSYRGSGHSIEANCPGHPIAYGVPEVVEQVLHNLIANALKYGPQDQPIEIDVMPGDPELKVAVRDRGPGIPMDELDAVFAPFYRSPETSDMATGMGVGLAVCRAMVDAMGGRMWAAEREGGGSELIFTLRTGPEEGLDELSARR